MDEVKKALDEEIISQIKDLSQMTSGCEVRTSAIDDLTALYKLRIEEEKLENELETKKLQMACEAAKAQQDKDEDERKHKFELRNKIIDTAVDVGRIVVPIAFYGAWFVRGLEFEKNGTFASTTLRNLIHFFKPVE